MYYCFWVSTQQKFVIYNFFATQTWEDTWTTYVEKSNLDMFLRDE